jgi:hypothetical protein
MSRRIKATINALQPRHLDYTKFAPGKTREPPMSVGTDDAAGALAMMAASGDPLAPLVFLFKRLDDRGAEVIGSIRNRLAVDLIEYAAIAGVPVTDMTYLEELIQVAVREWGIGSCPKCRVQAQGRALPKPGMVCSYCGNSGIATLKPYSRWRLVRDRMPDRRRSPDFAEFRATWHQLYLAALRQLRSATARIAAIDFRRGRVRIRDIDQGLEEQDQARAPDERG